MALVLPGAGGFDQPALPATIPPRPPPPAELLQLEEKSHSSAKGPKLIQVTNLSVKAADQQIEELFQQIGPVHHVEIYPKDKHRNKYGVLVAFVEFEQTCHVHIAQHLTSTVFIDRPIVVVPVSGIPSEYEVIQLAAAMSTTRQQELLLVAGTRKVKMLVQTIAPTIPSHIANPNLGNKPQPSMLVAGLAQAKELSDTSPKVPANVQLIAATGADIPSPPKLVEDYSMQKEREARRTIFVDNLNPYLTAEHILNFFQFCGDIRYLRIGGDWLEGKRFAFIEFFDLASVVVALQYDGSDFCNMQIRVTHSRHWLGKPPTKQTEAEREKDLLLKRLQEAQTAIANAVNEDSKRPEENGSPKKRRSRSRSRGHRRRRGSRDRSRDRSKSTKKKPRKRSRSHSRDKRSRSRDRRPRSRDRGRRSTSRSRDRRR